MWDYGARLMWRPTRAMYLSFETLQRNKSGVVAGTAAGDTSRTSGAVEYRIRQDLVVHASFGRDFEQDNGVRPLVSIMGLNVGFGAKPSVIPVAKPDR